MRRETRRTVGQGRALSGVGSCGPSYDRAPVGLCLSFLIITHRQPYPGITSPWRTTNHSCQDEIGPNRVCCGFSRLAATAWSASYVSLRRSRLGPAVDGRSRNFVLDRHRGTGKTDRPWAIMTDPNSDRTVARLPRPTAGLRPLYMMVGSAAIVIAWIEVFWWHSTHAGQYLS